MLSYKRKQAARTYLNKQKRQENYIDKDLLKAQINIVDLIGEDVSLEYLSNGEYLGLCPFHDDTKPTLYVNAEKGVYNCFSCKEGGDVIKYVMTRDKVDFFPALKTLLNFASKDYIPTKKPPSAEIKTLGERVYSSSISPKMDVKGFVFRQNKKYNHNEYVPTNFSRLYHYYDDKGLVGIVGRIEAMPEDDVYCETQKMFLPITLWEKGGVQTWHIKGLPEPTPLYNYDGLDGIKKPVLLVEGEKCADSVYDFFGTIDDTPFIPLTWRNGASCIHKTDWTPLQNRRVILWPDNDDAGKNTVKELSKILPQLEVLDLSRIANDKPPKWDVADFLDERDNGTFLSDDFINFIESNIINN
jgi:hypothetical protein